MIKSFVLNGGFRVIGEVEKENSKTFDMKNVIVYTFQDAGKGMSVNFGPFAPEAVEGKVEIYKTSITSTFVPDGNILNHYKEMFGHIVTAEPKLQLLN
jgi:hypothetical protein